MTPTELEELILVTLGKQRWDDPCPVDRHDYYVTSDVRTALGDSKSEADTFSLGVAIKDENDISLAQAGALLHRLWRIATILPRWRSGFSVVLRSPFEVKNRGIKMLECQLSVFETPRPYLSDDTYKAEEASV